MINYYQMNVQFNRRESVSSTSSDDSGTPIDGIEGEDYYPDVIQNKSFTVCCAFHIIFKYLACFLFFRVKINRQKCPVRALDCVLTPYNIITSISFRASVIMKSINRM